MSIFRVLLGKGPRAGVFNVAAPSLCLFQLLPLFPLLPLQLPTLLVPWPLPPPPANYCQSGQWWADVVGGFGTGTTWLSLTAGPLLSTCQDQAPHSSLGSARRTSRTAALPHQCQGWFINDTLSLRVHVWLVFLFFPPQLGLTERKCLTSVKSLGTVVFLQMVKSIQDSNLDCFSFFVFYFWRLIKVTTQSGHRHKTEVRFWF